MFRILTRRPFWVNLLVAIVLVVVAGFVFFNSLSTVTRHDENIKVPSIVGKNVKEATRLLESQGFAVEVQDSVYTDTAAKLAVVKQAPEANVIVKTNRIIFLTVNRAVAPIVEMPDLKGYSLKSAELYLQSLGLRLGTTTFKPDFTRNVLEQLYNGRSIKPGTKISMGVNISLVLGDGIGEKEMDVPYIVGMTYAQAKIFLQSKSINIGAVVVDTDVRDQENAFIYKQSPSKFDEPAPGQKIENKIRPGQVIDVWLSSSATKRDTTTVSFEEE